VNTPIGLPSDQPFVRDFAAHVGERTPAPLRHGLAGHGLFTLDALADLAGELGAESVAAEAAVKPLVGSALTAHGLPADTIAARIRALATEDAWFTLLNIEQALAYRTLVDEVLDGIASGAGVRPGALRRRMGFVFASSPGSVTPAHFDIEHSLLLQLTGHRRIGMGPFDSPAAREREVRRYWAGSFGRLEAMPEGDREVELAPGTGVYIPPYHPHWVTNGDQTSVSLTVTFFERSNERESRVQVMNERLRRIGLRPRPYGASAPADLVKHAAARAIATVRPARTAGSR
jgi:mannose-6-phosphate isomerase-like protein (cupin superfamily)